MSATTSLREKQLQPWSLSESYVEACTCEAICPSRMIGGRPGSRSTSGHCDFAVSWMIADGHAGPRDLSRLDVVMAGTWDDDPLVWQVQGRCTFTADFTHSSG